MALKSGLKWIIPGRLGTAGRAMSSYSLTYERFGEPADVLKKVQMSHDRTMKNTQVMLRYLASPINPADINTIQGVYPVKPAQFPAIGGNEGVAEVISVGPNVKHIKVGDRVIPLALASGTWTTHSVLTEKEICALDAGVDTMFAAQLTVNPCTAYRMLKDFVPLKAGDTVIQNGGASSVGVNVIQLAKIFEFKTINVIRDRDPEDFKKAKAELIALGADYVVSESQLIKKELMDSIFREIPKPKLALNCIGWDAATNCSRHLADNGVMVTYGGMSKKPVVIATGSFIFKNHSYVGFWMTRWRQQNSVVKLQKMFQELIDYNQRGLLKLPNINEVMLDDYEDVFKAISSGNTKGKFIFKF